MVARLDQSLQDSESFGEADSSSEMADSDPSRRSAWRFRLAMLQHHKTVYKVCYSLLGDAHEAEDVTQEAFIKYWHLADDVRGAKAWLITVARNKCLDRLRANKRFIDVDPEVFEQQTESRDPEWHAQQQESSSQLNALIAELPEPQRSLVVLFDIQGLTGAECAEVLGLNVNQVKVYLHRARKKLRSALEDGCD